MTGDRLERIARRIVRDETYRVMVAPAIADLQFEAPLGRWARVRAYVGTTCAIVGALQDEIRQDFALTCTQPALARAGATALTAIALQATLFLWMWSFNPYEHPIAFALLLPALISGGWPAAMLPAAAILARAHVPGARRVILIASAALAMFVLVVADQAVTETNQMFREQMFVAKGLPGPPARGPQERTLAELWQRSERDAWVSIHLRLSILGITPAWALLGFALRRARWIVLTGIGVLAYAFQFFSPVLASLEDAARLPVWSPWIPIGLILATAAIARRWSPRLGSAAG